MKGDIPAPALRLSAALTVRTHLAPEPIQRPKIIPEKMPQGMNNALPIRFRGKTYDSVAEAEAKRKLRCGYKSIQRWLDSKEAEYV